jgi:hypothetical protein
MIKMAASKTVPTYENVADYVAKLGGNRVIKRVLIANNGIAAVKAIRSIRKWAYETFGQEKEVCANKACCQALEDSGKTPEGSSDANGILATSH